jgi:hypothetical protein
MDPRNIIQCGTLYFDPLHEPFNRKGHDQEEQKDKNNKGDPFDPFIGSFELGYFKLFVLNNDIPVFKVYFPLGFKSAQLYSRFL